MLGSDKFFGKDMKQSKGVEGLPGGTRDKESTCWYRRQRRWGLDPWVGKIPWNRKWQPPPLFLPEKPRGQRSLVGTSAWNCKASDTTERACVCTHTYTHTGLNPRDEVRWSWDSWACFFIKNMLQIGLVEQMRFEKWFENAKDSSLVDIWGGAFQREHRESKCSEEGVQLRIFQE